MLFPFLYCYRTKLILPIFLEFPTKIPTVFLDFNAHLIVKSYYQKLAQFFKSTLKSCNFNYYTGCLESQKKYFSWTIVLFKYALHEVILLGKSHSKCKNAPKSI